MLSYIDSLIGGLVILRNATRKLPCQGSIWVGTLEDGKLAVYNAALDIPVPERACLRELGWVHDKDDECNVWVYMF